MTKPNRKRRALVAATLGLALGLLVAELGVRIALDPHAAAKSTSRRLLPRWTHLLDQDLFQYESDPRLHYSLTPGFDFEYEGVRYRTNSLGMRGPEVTQPKPPGTRRILLVGDSYAYGLGAPEDGTLQAHLARKLTSPASPTEVLNLGVPAFHTGQELAWLEQRGFELEPDLVMLVYFANDATEPAYHYNPALQILSTDETAVPYTMKRALWRSTLYAMLARRSADTYASSGAMTAGTGQTWPVVEARLQAFADACEDRGVPLVIVNLPSVQLAEVTADDERFAPHLRDAERVTAFAKANEIQCIELAPVLQDLARNNKLDELLVDPNPGAFYDDHFTGAGNGIVATAIARGLEN